MTLLLSTILLLIGTGILSLFVRPVWKGRVVSAGALISAILILPSVLSVLLSGDEQAVVLNLAPPVGAVRFILDPLSAFFLVPILTGGFLAAVYSLGYMKPYLENNKSLSVYHFFLPLLIASMTAVVLVRNSLMFLTAWEIMSVSSFFLVIFEHEKQEVRKAGLTYLIAMQFGASLLIAAFAWTVLRSGVTDMDGLSVVFRQHGPSSILLFLLFFFGFGTKAGFIPVHTWLPEAHPAAPTPVSSLMSGVMIKTGIYGILRILMFYGSPEMGLALTVFFLAAVSGVFGVVHAIAQHDIKKLLAYHSIENIGIIGMGIGLGMIGLAAGNHTAAMLGFAGALLHVWNHFIFKSALFYSAGAVYLRTHTRNLEKLGGLVHVMPVTAAVFLIASMAISGLPLFNGFISEFFIYMGLLDQLSVPGTWAAVSSILGLGALALIGILAVLCFSKVYSVAFLGSARSSLPQLKNDPPRSMLWPMLLLTFLMPLIGLFPRLTLPLLVHAASNLTGQEAYLFPQNVHSLFEILSKVFILFLVIILALMLLRQILLKIHGSRLFRTWDCGARIPDSRLQYTGSSFAGLFLDLIPKVVPRKIHHEKPEGFFPEKAVYESHAEDRIESLFIRPLTTAISWALKPFEKIQTGKTRQYLLYGLVFLILILVSIIGAYR